MSTRLDIRKTYKLYVGGGFVRSESGRVSPARSARGRALDNYSVASRKDLRDAVVAARKACGGWAAKSAYLRGQILYRAAEMLEQRSAEMRAELARSTQAAPSAARREVSQAVDRLVHFAGWTDKYAQVFGSVNPVASPHFNFTTPEPMGVVVALAPDQPALLPLVSLFASTVLSGNAVILIASESFPLPALTFAEVIATSDLPAGVANVLTGSRKDLVPHIAAHMDINAVIDATGDTAIGARLREGTSANLKRYADHSMSAKEWAGPRAEDPARILDAVEFKTAWHPVGL